MLYLLFRKGGFDMELIKIDCYKKDQIKTRGITANADGPFILV